MPTLHARAVMAFAPVGVPVRSPRNAWATGVNGW